MPILERPFAASAAARLLQAGSRVGAKRAARAAAARLPEYRGRPRELLVPTLLGPARGDGYRPIAATRGVGDEDGGPPPVHLNLHGGGYVLGLMAGDDPLCRVRSAEAGVVVLNVGYALAPQHPFPRAVDQVFEIVRWVAANGRAQGWDGTRVTVGGQSAGAGLAAAAARLAFERGGPPVMLQVLHYPPLDLTPPCGTKPSPVARPALRPWMCAVFEGAYAPDPAARADRLVSPAGPADTADLTGIAPALVIAAEHDILRDEARRYADRLDRVGALVEYREVPGADHGYDRTDDAQARDTYKIIAGHVRRAGRPAAR